ncbi:trypsin-like serine protease [Solihabitans fulvus]|uniref:Trypsin-like serine protease n=1 Tax=Solihabitans fulvus TaxID=1892852 RepID=A0A5B2XL20_9PSEU|nr:trypsin-like peptidase domain-containing protein [Solihabitans fulvus]KAA2264053.1 trypsin-like serine protease [Solihabitans fulvus]
MSQQPNPIQGEPGEPVPGQPVRSQQGNGQVPVGTPVSGVDDGAGRRLQPRPLARPAVDPTLAAAFARPPGVPDAFVPRQPPQSGPNGLNGSNGSVRLAPPPPEALATAFGRPYGGDDLRLQRPPGEQDPTIEPDIEPVFWSSEAAGDPWRNPGAGTVIGPPAVGEHAGDTEQGEDAAARPSGKLLSVPELLFGRRVRPRALVTLFVAALVIGAAGGLVGWGIARGGNPLTDSGVTLAQVNPGKERPAGSVAEIAKKVTPSVVSIELKGSQLSGVGSGIVIDGKGYILTNDHVVDVAAKDTSVKMTVQFTDGTRAEAKTVGRDPKTDLAVVKVEANNLTVIQFGNSDNLQAGDTVIAIGSPLGYENSVTSGIVSALHRPVTAGGDGGSPAVTYDAIQTDAAINHGNSGGALVDSTGALVGINSSIMSSSADGGSIGLGFAIPVNDAKRIAEVLIHSGQVKHPDMGVNAKSASANTAEGAQVVNVTEGGAAALAGIKEGDIITKVGDRQIRKAPELTVAQRQHNIGDTVPVQLARDGRQLTLQVTLKSD